MEALSPELQLIVLLNIEIPSTLYSLLRASPRFLRVFQNNKTNVLSRVATRQFHPAILTEVVQLANLYRLPHPVSRSTSLSFLENEWPMRDQRCENVQSISISACLCKLARMFDFFAHDFAISTLPIMSRRNQAVNFTSETNHLSGNTQYGPTTPGTSDRVSQGLAGPNISNWALSPTEMTRLQRAFCRFEIYRIVSARCSVDHDHRDDEDSDDGEDWDLGWCPSEDPPLTVTEQREMFLQTLPAWQIEEIASVRDYLFRRFQGIFDELEEEGVKEVQPAAFYGLKDEDSSLYNPRIWFYTVEGKRRQEGHKERLLSTGLPRIRKILTCSGNERRDVTLADCTLLHHEDDFLSKALDHTFMDMDLQTAIDYTSDQYDILEPPTGWVWAHIARAPYRSYSCKRKGFRDWGYDFWDRFRFEYYGLLDLE